LEYEFIKEKKESRTYTHIPFQEQERERGKQLQLIFYFCLHTTDTPSGSAYKRVLITHGKTLYQSITSLFFLLNFNMISTTHILIHLSMLENQNWATKAKFSLFQAWIWPLRLNLAVWWCALAVWWRRWCVLAMVLKVVMCPTASTCPPTVSTLTSPCSSNTKNKTPTYPTTIEPDLRQGRELPPLCLLLLGTMGQVENTDSEVS